MIATFLPGGAVAHAPNPNASCSGLGDETLVVAGIVPLTVQAPVLGTLYVGEDQHVYRETNGVSGLQTHEHTCTLVNRAKGTFTRVTIDADELVL